MAVAEIDYDGAASGIMAVLHEKGIPISKVSRVFETAMQLIEQYTVPFDPSSLETEDQAEGTDGSADTAEQDVSDEEAHNKALEMIGGAG